MKARLRRVAACLLDLARPPHVRDYMNAQRTLRRAISCAGIGLHSGNKVTLSLKPAPADYGIRFSGRTWEISRSRPQSIIGGIQYATGLARDAASVETVEHLLAALATLGVDNVRVELNYPEVPIMDGSAAPFVYFIEEAGVKRLASPRRYLKVLRPIALSQATSGSRSIRRTT